MVDPIFVAFFARTRGARPFPRRPRRLGVGHTDPGPRAGRGVGMRLVQQGRVWRCQQPLGALDKNLGNLPSENLGNLPSGND